MASAEKDPLRQLLHRQSAALAAKAVAGGTISPEEIEGLGLLARLVEIRQAAMPGRRNWWPAGVLSGSLALLSALLFFHVPETDVELDVAATELGFELAREQALLGTTRLTALGISGVAEARVPVSPPPPAGLSALQLSTRAGGVVTLAPLTLPAGAALNLRPADLPGRLTLAIQAPGAELRADVAGPLTLNFAGVPPREAVFPVPKPIVLRAGPHELDLDLALPAFPAKPFLPQLAARDLRLFRIDEFNQGGRTLVRRVSTIVSGTLFLESLDGRERRLRPGEALEFEKSAGEIREIRVEEHQVGLRYHGRVRGMTTGSGEAHRSLMPTYLEWLRARHSLSLFWGSALYAFGLAAAALRWWGVRV